MRAKEVRGDEKMTGAKEIITLLKEKSRLSLEAIAKELLSHWKQVRGSGDIQSMVQDTAQAHGVNAEDLYEIVSKLAKKMKIDI